MTRGRTVCAVLALAALGLVLSPEAAPADPPFPYELEGDREFWLNIGSVGGYVLVRDAERWLDRRSFTEEEIRALDPGRVPGFDRHATRNRSETLAGLSDLTLGASYLAPLSLMKESPVKATSDGVGTVFTVYLETQILTFVVTDAIKVLANRTRPFVYHPEAPLTEKLGTDARRSFPSGHASAGFAAATYWGVVYDRLHTGSSAWVWTTGFGLATATAVLRVASGRHFPSDVVVGALLGAAVGWIVPRIHEIDGESAGESEAIAPRMLSFSVSF